MPGLSMFENGLLGGLSSAVRERTPQPHFFAAAVAAPREAVE